MSCVISLRSTSHNLPTPNLPTPLLSSPSSCFFRRKQRKTPKSPRVPWNGWHEMLSSEVGPVGFQLPLKSRRIDSFTPWLPVEPLMWLSCKSPWKFSPPFGPRRSRMRLPVSATAWPRWLVKKYQHQGFLYIYIYIYIHYFISALC